jgi:hypothetical protein
VYVYFLLIKELNILKSETAPKLLKINFSKKKSNLEILKVNEQQNESNLEILIFTLTDENEYLLSTYYVGLPVMANDTMNFLEADFKSTLTVIKSLQQT